jgi:hypothetical protein
MSLQQYDGVLKKSKLSTDQQKVQMVAAEILPPLA